MMAMLGRGAAGIAGAATAGVLVANDPDADTTGAS
jgi:hypothetical protein